MGLEVVILVYKKTQGEEKYANILRHIQFINVVLDVLHLSSGCNSGLQNFY